ncbi:MAG TPA: SAM-dependent methyltransferase, partial [Alphaproteobacteria bacterium]|nr:SAM-dependent methyltransferase [Alphaproteobacteria bacterium]
VTFVTGHNAMGAVPDAIDWEAVAKGSPVIVIYMALKHLAAIAERLIEGGRRRDEKVAIVCDATLPTQRVLETELGRAAQDAAAAGLEPPAIVAVGEVVALRRELDWLGRFVRRKATAGP